MPRTRHQRRFVFDDPRDAIAGYGALGDEAARYRLYVCVSPGGQHVFAWARSPREALGRAARRFRIQVRLVSVGDLA